MLLRSLSDLLRNVESARIWIIRKRIHRTNRVLPLEKSLIKGQNVSNCTDSDSKPIKKNKKKYFDENKKQFCWSSAMKKKLNLFQRKDTPETVSVIYKSFQGY